MMGDPEDYHLIFQGLDCNHGMGQVRGQLNDNAENLTLIIFCPVSVSKFDSRSSVWFIYELI